ncbi:MAG: molybdenum cofactor biosynthesis protein MoaE [Nitrososphaerales archaeon]
MPQIENALSTGVYPKKQVDFSKLYSQFIAGLDSGTGSATTFLGVARRESADGKKSIRALVMESYEKHANKVLKEICLEVKKKYGLGGIVIVHALGSFKPGEPVVFVGVSSPRRDRSFKALREAVERYKKEPALFKQEVYLDGTSAWID